MLLLLASILIGAAAFLSDTVQNGQTITSVDRNQAGDGSQSIELTAQKDGDDPLKISINVPEMDYTDEEAGAVLDELLLNIDGLILGDNTSFDEIRHDLDLPTYFDDYKVSAAWRSSAWAVIGADGVIGDKASEDGSEAVLKAVLTLGECERSYEKKVTVYPSEDKGLESRLKNAAELLNEDNESDEYILPDSINGQKISWYRSDGISWQNLSLLLLAAGILVFFVKREKQKEEKKKKLEELEREYPDLVSRLLLLMHAGLNCRKAFYYMDEESRKNKSGGAVIKEVSLTCRDMAKGVSEGDAYRRFAERCMLPCYKNLAVLLDQNLKKGGSGLISLLEQETVIAFEDRKRQARIKGEQTSIKLLFPMIMMLGVVMIIVIVPAFMSM